MGNEAWKHETINFKLTVYTFKSKDNNYLAHICKLVTTVVLYMSCVRAYSDSLTATDCHYCITWKCKYSQRVYIYFSFFIKYSKEILINMSKNKFLYQNFVFVKYKWSASPPFLYIITFFQLEVIFNLINWKYQKNIFNLLMKDKLKISFSILNFYF